MKDGETHDVRHDFEAVRAALEHDDVCEEVRGVDAPAFDDNPHDGAEAGAEADGVGRVHRPRVHPDFVRDQTWHYGELGVQDAKEGFKLSLA